MREERRNGLYAVGGAVAVIGASVWSAGLLRAPPSQGLEDAGYGVLTLSALTFGWGMLAPVAVSRGVRWPRRRGKVVGGLRPKGGLSSEGKLPLEGGIPAKPDYYVPREDLLVALAKVFRRRLDAAVAVTGLPGVGKTEVAAAYARERAHRWPLVGWVNADTEISLLAGLAKIAEAMGVADSGGESHKSASRLRDHLDIWSGRALLVFDDANDPDLVRKYVPSVGRTQVVVTTRLPDFAPPERTVQVGPFTSSQSAAFLDARPGYRFTDDPDTGSLARKLGDLPVALRQAANVIVQGRLTCASYLGLLRDVPVQDLLSPERGQGYEQSVAAAFLLSIEQAEESDATRLTGLLLRVVAVLSADGVRLEFLSALCPDADAEKAKWAVGAAVRRCRAASLLTWIGDLVVMHGLEAMVLRDRDRARGQLDATVIVALDLLVPLLFPEDEAWPRRAEGAHLVTQAEALWEAARGTGDQAVRVRLLQTRSWGMRQLAAASDLGGAISLGVRVLQDCEMLLGPYHRQTLIVRCMLARAYVSADQRDQAISQYRRAVRDCKLGLGRPDRQSLIARNGLASAYARAGKLGPAIVIQRQALADCERFLGSDDPETLNALNTLASAICAADRLGEAIMLYEKALKGREAVLGADHLHVLESRNNLAYALQRAGRLNEAIPRYIAVLAQRERFLGADHPQTLMSRSNLGDAYREAGELDQAISVLERAALDCERVLGPDNSQTLISRLNHAWALFAAGQLSQPVRVLAQIVDDFERLLEADHSDTLNARDNLAYACFAAGDLTRALSFYQSLYEDRARVMGTTSSDTRRSKINLDYVRDWATAGTAISAVSTPGRRGRGRHGTAAPRRRRPRQSRRDAALRS